MKTMRKTWRAAWAAAGIGATTWATAARLAGIGLLGAGLLGGPAGSAAVRADEPAKPAATPAKADAKPAESLETLHKRFTEQMSGVKLVGRFTVLGKENDKATAEEYRILSVQKMDAGDYWLLTARIKYGQHDVTVPMPLEVKWAGSTPVITLDKVAIPGLGTFSARVLFHEKMYSGTWMHDQVGGHLFGTYEKLKPEEAAEKPNEKPAPKQP